MTNGTTGTMVPQGQTLLSAGSDPISEGRRSYIGNLKYVDYEKYTGQPFCARGQGCCPVDQVDRASHNLVPISR